MGKNNRHSNNKKEGPSNGKLSALDRRSIGAIAFFVRNKVAANLLLVLVLILGAFSLMRLNTQFLPPFNLKLVTIRVDWPGASPRDVEKSITVPIEYRLKNLSQVKKLESVSGQHFAYIVVQMKQGANLLHAVTRIREFVAQVPDLPEGSKKPIVNQVEVFDPIARVLVTTQNNDIEALYHWSKQFERQLLQRGIAKVTIHGMAKRILTLDLSPQQMLAIGQAIQDVGRHVKNNSDDASTGKVALSSGGHSIRVLEKKRTRQDLSEMPILTTDTDLLQKLLSMAQIKHGYEDYPKLVMYQGFPAIDLSLWRTSSFDALKSASILNQWFTDIKPTLPEGMKVLVYNQYWHYIRDRINLLLENGLSGLLLIVFLLLLFFHWRVASWVTLGIPISIAAAFFYLDLSGGTINMISLFAMIMTLGIIVDDTIVVSEQGVTEYQQGLNPQDAVIRGAQRMVKPLLASSATTIAAFSPLMFLGGIFGQILIAIPQVVICVVLASLLESFFILPRHLSTSLQALSHHRPSALRLKLDHAFSSLRDIYFKNFVDFCIHRFVLTLSICVSMFLIIFGLLVGGHLRFNFFPSPDGAILSANVNFMPGASEKAMKSYMFALEEHVVSQAQALEKKSGDSVLEHVIVNFYHQSSRRGDPASAAKDRSKFASLFISLTPPEQRRISNQVIINQIKEGLPKQSSVESVSISARRSGPPGDDIDIAFVGDNPNQLKQAALAFQSRLETYKGVYGVKDNMPYSPDDWILSLRPAARAAGLSVQSIVQQLRAAISGYPIQLYYENGQEKEVVVRLSQAMRDRYDVLDHLFIHMPNQAMVPLKSLVTLRKQKSFSTLQHLNGRLTVRVQASVNANMANANQILSQLKSTVLPSIMSQYNVGYSSEGLDLDQKNTLSQMKRLVFVSLIFIYLVLVLVSSSYLWPLFVMVAIPFGLMGALFGHLLLHQAVTLLSLFGFFGLAGIVINDSIILLIRYQECTAEGLPSTEAIVSACCQRLRPVLLTSLTTIVGLAPLLFERSQQAAFLIPMAISLCFGLLFATVLILVMIPALIAASDAVRAKWRAVS